MPKILLGTEKLDFPLTCGSCVADFVLDVPGVENGDVVSLGIPAESVTATGSYMAWVSDTDKVTIRFSPKLKEDPKIGLFKVKVSKF